MGEIYVIIFIKRAARNALCWEVCLYKSYSSFQQIMFTDHD